MVFLWTLGFLPEVFTEFYCSWKINVPMFSSKLCSSRTEVLLHMMDVKKLSFHRVSEIYSSVCFLLWKIQRLSDFSTGTGLWVLNYVKVCYEITDGDTPASLGHTWVASLRNIIFDFCTRTSWSSLYIFPALCQCGRFSCWCCVW